MFPRIKESDYITEQGEFRVDSQGKPAMLESLMYKLCYYRFGDITTAQGVHHPVVPSWRPCVALMGCCDFGAGRPSGWDNVRNYEIGKKDINLEYVDEAFTSEHWIVRIYKVGRPCRCVVSW